MKAVLFGITVAVLGYFAAQTFSQAAMEDMDFKNPVVLELFTSQSCSSCPSADKLIQSISDQENLIVLACHVSYWNHLHWEDTLSREFCSARQRNYITNQRSNRVFTPQVLVNGQYSAVGSQALDVNAALSRAKQNPIYGLKLKQTGSDIKISLPPELNELKNPYVSVITSNPERQTQRIGHGENGGRTLTYQNNVLDIREGYGKLNFADIRQDKNHNLTVLLYEKPGGEILAAGRL